MQSSELGGTAHYVFVIGSTDDFESAEELDDAVDAPTFRTTDFRFPLGSMKKRSP
jgi:hypothetical protein